MSTRKPTKYHRILKEFTKLNSKLPEDQKLSYKERRKIVKDILPQYEGVPVYKIRIKPLKALFNNQIQAQPNREALCDINYIDPSEYALVQWFELDGTLSSVMPDCIYVKVSTRDYGSTRIFNTRDYEYSSNGVREIIENLRPDANNNSGTFMFQGFKKLRPKKRNNGVPENYYLDFILIEVDSNGNEFPQADTEEVVFELPKTREVRIKKAKVNKIIEKRISKLKYNKAKVKRAKKAELNRLEREQQKAQKKAEKQKIEKATEKKVLAKLYKQGILTKAEYTKAIKEIK